MLPAKPAMPGMSASDMNVATRLRDLESLHNCHSEQLAAHEHTIKSITKENDNLRSTRDEDRGTIRELTAALTKAQSSGADQAQIEYLAKSLCDVRARLDVLSMKEKSASSSVTQDLTTESKLKLEGMYETQKMQSTSISAVAGQVGALDKLLQGTGGALNKEMQNFNTILVVQAGKIQALEADGKEMHGTIARLQQDKKEVSCELRRLKSRLSDIRYDAHFDDEYYLAKAHGSKLSKQDDEIMHLRSMLDRSEENYKSLSNLVEKLRSELAETKAEAGRSLCVHRANTTADRERWIQMDSKVTKLQGDVTGLQKRVQHNAIDTDMALESLSGDVADLDKRTDEGVVVTDARVAAAVARVTEVEDKITAVKAQIAGGHAVAFESGTTPDEFKRMEGNLRNTTAKVEEMLATTETLRQETQAKLADLAANENSKLGISEFSDEREAVDKGFRALHNTVEKLSLSVEGIQANAASKAALDSTNTALAALRDATDTLTGQCQFPGMSSTTVGEFIISKIDDEAQETQDDSTCKIQTLKGRYDILEAKFKAVKSEKDKRLAGLTTQVTDQNRTIQEFTSKVNGLSSRFDDAFAAHDTRITNLHTHFSKLDASQTARLGISAKEQGELKKQVSALELCAAKAMTLKDLVPHVQAAKDANQAKTAELVEQIDTAKSALIKDTEQRLSSQIRNLTSRLERATGPRSNPQAQLTTLSNRINTLTNDMSNISQSVRALEGSRGEAVEDGAWAPDRGETHHSYDWWSSRYDSDDDLSDDGWGHYGGAF